jgi:hypothetical protein
LENAADLVRRKVDVIVTFFTPTTLAAKQATREIPIVMAGAGDPVATGLVASFARPGGNVTGQAGGGGEVAGKSVELIREFIPAAHRVGVLVIETISPSHMWRRSRRRPTARAWRSRPSCFGRDSRVRIRDLRRQAGGLLIREAERACST